MKFSQPVNQNKYGRKNCPETSRANFLLLREGGFCENCCAYNDRRRVNLLADFANLIQEPSGNCFI